MNDTIPITKSGLVHLKAELKILITVDRLAIRKAIAEERAHGDLSENAEYHAAKEKQGFIEGRIQQINAKLANFQVVDPTEHQSHNVAFGAKVTFENVDTEEISSYQIVGPDEADLQSHRISFRSPIAQALIGKTIGDVVVISVPRGTIEVEVLEVVYE